MFKTIALCFLFVQIGYLEFYRDAVKNFDNEKKYADLTFENKATKETKKFNELPLIHRKVFILIQAETLTKALEKEYEKTDSKEELLKIRKELAARYEKYAKDMFNRHKKDFIKSEIDVYLKKMEDYNKKHNLTE